MAAKLPKGVTIEEHDSGTQYRYKESGFLTPHLSKMLNHVEKRPAILAAREAAAAAASGAAVVAAARKAAERVAKNTAAQPANDEAEQPPAGEGAGNGEADK